MATETETTNEIVHEQKKDVKQERESRMIIHDQKDETKSSFEELKLSPAAIKALNERQQVTSPTAMQDFLLKQLPLQDHLALIGQRSQGKTTAGVLTALKSIDFELDKVQVLYLAYTESNVSRTARQMYSLKGEAPLKLYQATISKPIHFDMRTLFRTVNHVAIGNLGRIHDLVRQKATDFSGVKLVVLDQGDLLFTKPVKAKILSEMLSQLPPACKVLLLSRPAQRQRNMLDFCEESLGGKNNIHFFKSSRSRSTSRRRSPSEMVRSAHMPERPLKWAMFTPLDKEKFDIADIGKFISDLTDKLRDYGKEEGATNKVDFDEKPAFVNRIEFDEAKDKMDQLREQLKQAKENNVDVLFFTGPLNMNRFTISRFLAEAAKEDITIHPVRATKDRYPRFGGRKGGMLRRRRRSASHGSQEDSPKKEEEAEDENTFKEMTEDFIHGHMKGLVRNYVRMNHLKSAALPIERTTTRRRSEGGRRRIRQIHVQSSQVSGDNESAKNAQTIELLKDLTIEGPVVLQFQLLSTGGASGDGDSKNEAHLDVESEGGSNHFQVNMRSGRLIIKAVKEVKTEQRAAAAPAQA